MSISGSPRFGAICDVTDLTPASSVSASAQTRPVTLGPSSASANTALPATLVAGTGSPSSVNAILDGQISLAGGATLTIDLSSFNSGAKSLTKCRGCHFVNSAAADAGSGSGFTVSAASSNGFTAGGNLPPSTAPATVSPNGSLNATNLNTAGWAVTGSAKQVVITAGALGASGYFAFIGE